MHTQYEIYKYKDENKPAVRSGGGGAEPEGEKVPVMPVIGKRQDQSFIGPL